MKKNKLTKINLHKNFVHKIHICCTCCDVLKTWSVTVFITIHFVADYEGRIHRAARLRELKLNTDPVPKRARGLASVVSSGPNPF